MTYLDRVWLEATLKTLESERVLHICQGSRTQVG